MADPVLISADTQVAVLAERDFIATPMKSDPALHEFVYGDPVKVTDKARQIVLGMELTYWPAKDKRIAKLIVERLVKDQWNRFFSANLTGGSGLDIDGKPIASPEMAFDLPIGLGRVIRVGFAAVQDCKTSITVKVI